MEKVHITLTDDILDLIDEECNITADSRSCFIRRAIVYYLEKLYIIRQFEDVNFINKMVDCLSNDI